MAAVPPYDLDAPWGIEEDACHENPWQNQWHVNTDEGEGTRLATFEFSSHAEEFIRRCGPACDRITVQTEDGPKYIEGSA